VFTQDEMVAALAAQGIPNPVMMNGHR